MPAYGFTCALGNRGRPCGASGLGAGLTSQPDATTVLRADLDYLMDQTESIVPPPVTTAASFFSAVEATVRLYSEEPAIDIHNRAREWLSDLFPRGMTWKQMRAELFPRSA